MKKILDWWYALSLPRHLLSVATPVERERTRYAQLTAGFLLLLICVFIPVSPIMLFFSPASPSSPPIAIGMFGLLALSWLCGRLGRQILSACCIIAYIFLSVTGPLLTNPLDASLIPVFSAFTIAVVLAGALMPPVAALVTGVLSCLDIVVVASLALHTDTYSKGAQLHLATINVLSVAVILPCLIQILVAVVIYVIMRNLLSAIRRADRAEEIVALQGEIAEYERVRMREERAA